MPGCGDKDMESGVLHKRRCRCDSCLLSSIRHNKEEMRQETQTIGHPCLRLTVAGIALEFGFEVAPTHCPVIPFQPVTHPFLCFLRGFSVRLKRKEQFKCHVGPQILLHAMIEVTSGTLLSHLPPCNCSSLR